MPHHSRPPLDELLESALTPGAFVDALQAHACASVTAKHPLLLALADGAFSDLQRALVSFLREYYVYSRSFTRHLGAVSACLEDPNHRAMLVPNAAEEAGALDVEHAALLAKQGISAEDAAGPHPLLFRRFLDVVGLTDEDLSRSKPHVATVAWIESFHAVCRTDEAQAVGALGIATEGIVRSMYAELLTAIRRAYPHLLPRDYAFFALHAAVDDEHAAVLRTIAVQLAQTSDGRRRLAIGVVKALSLRSSFYEAMHEHLVVRASAERAA